MRPKPRLLLLQLGFFVGNVLARNRIKFLDLDFFGSGALVLGGGIEMTCTSTGFQFDFFTHDSYSLDLFAASAHFKQHGIDTILVDRAQTGIGQAQGHVATLALYPQTTTLQIWQETTLGFVVRVRHIIAHSGALTSYLTDACHSKLLQPVFQRGAILPYKSQAVQAVISPGPSCACRP